MNQPNLNITVPPTSIPDVPDLRKRFGLNVKQENFTLRVAAGEAPTVAYMVAYHGKKARVNSKPYVQAAAAASRLVRNEKVAAALKELRKEPTEKAVLTRQRKREILSKKAEGKDDTAALRAIDIDNKMQGEYLPDQEDVQKGLHSIVDLLAGAQKKPDTEE